jgi:hypothetical protein
VYSSVIGKIHKAHQYAREPERIRIDQLRATIHGDNDEHVVTYTDGKWDCGCQFFHSWRICAHTMAVEELLGVMVPVKQHFPDPVAA